MTVTKLTRRTALAGAVTLPAALAPLGPAQAADTSAEPDPFVSAFRRYLEAESAYVRACEETKGQEWDEDEEHVNALCDSAAAAMLEMGQTVPTTAHGLYLAICALLPVFGEYKAGGNLNPLSFDDMTVRGLHTNGCDEALLRSLRTAAERMAKEGV